MHTECYCYIKFNRRGACFRGEVKAYLFKRAWIVVIIPTAAMVKSVGMSV